MSSHRRDGPTLPIHLMHHEGNDTIMRNGTGPPSEQSFPLKDTAYREVSLSFILGLTRTNTVKWLSLSHLHIQGSQVPLYDQKMKPRYLIDENVQWFELLGVAQMLITFSVTEIIKTSYITQKRRFH